MTREFWGILFARDFGILVFINMTKEHHILEDHLKPDPKTPKYKTHFGFFLDKSSPE